MTPLQIVESYYKHFNNREWEGMLSLVDENIKHEPNQGEPRIGKELFTAFLKNMDESYAETLKDIVLFESSVEGRIAAEFVVHGIYKKGEQGMPIAKGQAYVLPAAAFLNVQHGKITRVTTYYNLEQWITLVS